MIEFVNPLTPWEIVKKYSCAKWFREHFRKRSTFVIKKSLFFEDFPLDAHSIFPAIFWGGSRKTNLLKIPLKIQLPKQALRGIWNIFSLFFGQNCEQKMSCETSVFPSTNSLSRQRYFRGYFRMHSHRLAPPGNNFYWQFANKIPNGSPHFFSGAWQTSSKYDRICQSAHSVRDC